MLKFLKSSLVVFLGFVFIFSAVAKMVPLEFFEFQIAEIINTDWRNVQILARVIISLEFALGILLVLNFELRRFTLPFAFGLLLGFSLILISQLILHGNQENCGCFGDQVEMSTSAGLLKNIFMMAVVALVYFLAPKWEIRIKHGVIIAALLFVLLMIIQYNMMKPIEWTSISERKKIDEPANYGGLYNTDYADPIPSFDYKVGKHIVIFADVNCNHCKLAVAKSSIIKAQEPEVSFLIVIDGTPEEFENFKELTHAENLEMINLNNDLGFIRMARSSGLPSINWINNGILEYQTVHYELIKEDIQDWLQKD